CFGQGLEYSLVRLAVVRATPSGERQGRLRDRGIAQAGFSFPGCLPFLLALVQRGFLLLVWLVPGVVAALLRRPGRHLLRARGLTGPAGLAGGCPALILVAFDLL